MSVRSDLIVEVDTTLDGGGLYVGDWIDSGGIQRLRGVVQGGSLSIDESSDQSVVLRTVALADGDEMSVTARYFRMVGTGSPSAAFRAVFRVAG